MLDWGGGSGPPTVGTYTEEHEQTRCRQTSVLRVVFEPTISVIARKKTLRAWDREINVARWRQE
jgi:hypothetical protein